ncbi:MAG: protein kinase [Planctomycetota bacterium]
MSQRKKLSNQEIVELFDCLADGMRSIHEAGLVHKDLKPKNIVIGSDGKPRIIDFGLSAPMAGGEDRHIAGTATYMSPGKPPECIAWMLEVIFLASVQFFTKHSRRSPLLLRPVSRLHLRSARKCNFENPRVLNANVSVFLEQICLRCLEKSLHERFHSAAEIQARLAVKPGIAASFSHFFATKAALCEVPLQHYYWLPPRYRSLHPIYSRRLL